LAISCRMFAPRRERGRGGGIPGAQSHTLRCERRRGQPKVVWGHRRRRKSFPNGGRGARRHFGRRLGEREKRERRRALTGETSATGKPASFSSRYSSVQVARSEKSFAEPGIFSQAGVVIGRFTEIGEGGFGDDRLDARIGGRGLQRDARAHGFAEGENMQGGAGAAGGASPAPTCSDGQAGHRRWRECRCARASRRWRWDRRWRRERGRPS